MSARKKTIAKRATSKAPGKSARKRAPVTAAAARKATRKTSLGQPGASDQLTEYRHKRDFQKTAEPAGRVKSPRRGELRFVVQKHDASHLHYDLRLEVDGVMKSWAVPKGPSTDPTVRRLAMQVEDHPVEYNTFEGTIPAGEYGGGTVMLWDTGTYGIEDAAGRPQNAAAHDEYERGEMKVVFHGKRLKGSYALVRTKGMAGSRSSKPSWLLIKHRDASAHPEADSVITEKFTTSVTTGRTMDEICNAD